MAPALASSASQISHFSPAELSYLHTSLSYPNNPIRPDGRSATQFRPLTAETDILPNTNGSARIGFADGTQAIVGVKAEIEKTVNTGILGERDGEGIGEGEGGGTMMRYPVFLREMMREALVDLGRGILLLSPPLSYPLPLLSLTTHLALLSTKLPKLISKDEEDPMFDDDWALAEYLYPRTVPNPAISLRQPFRPPITLLVIAVGENIIFDPSREEIAVADAVFCVSIGRDEQISKDKQDQDAKNAVNIGVSAGDDSVEQQPVTSESVQGVWKPRQGGVKKGLISKIVKLVLQRGGVGDEVMQGLEGVEVG
ncbi:hypothetical protein CISG_01579 [Coccidioides immitis RMSCC 3703]|uniref:Ribosomal RNA-processing protein 42 n=1 Tax=Coccidioides immitis RMSCC 3703 TaxID=454286 RepID=A0A0J8R2B9_COCIT|nr:hypothetical protein CISG_01579 [Coccidioides immitis RMSCC 3703]